MIDDDNTLTLKNKINKLNMETTKKVTFEDQQQFDKTAIQVLKASREITEKSQHKPKQPTLTTLQR